VGVHDSPIIVYGALHNGTSRVSFTGVLSNLKKSGTEHIVGDQSVISLFHVAFFIAEVG
jgi:hypothetical protein